MTYDLTLHTDIVTLATVGSAIAVALFAWIGIVVASKLSQIGEELEGLPRTMDDMTRIILRKDFTYKPKFDENDASLKIGPESFAPYRLFPWSNY